MNKVLFLSISFFLINISFADAQRNFNEFNLYGVSGGMTVYRLDTDNFKTRKANSYMGGVQVRGNVYNNFDMLYGISFYGNNVGIAVKESGSSSPIRYVDFSTQAVQIAVLGGYKIIRNHLSVELGPVLNINGKLKGKNSQYENYTIVGYDDLRPKDIERISPVNFHVAAGLTAGFQNFRVFTQYQYGITNMLGKLNGSHSEIRGFEGHATMFVFGVTGYF